MDINPGYHLTLDIALQQKNKSMELKNSPLILINEKLPVTSLQPSNAGHRGTVAGWGY